MVDPDNRERQFFRYDHESIFKTQISYVQQGFLSDPPGMTMYYKKSTSKTGFVFYRCLRSTSPLEGHHMQLRASRDPRARHSSPRVQHAESLWFDFGWNIRATVNAALMPHIGHEHVWLRDLLSDILRDTPLAKEIEELKGWHRVNTWRKPIVPRGFIDPTNNSGMFFESTDSASASSSSISSIN